MLSIECYNYIQDIIGVNATLHNDLGQKWYTTSGPLLIQQGSLVLETLENTKVELPQSLCKVLTSFKNRKLLVTRSRQR